MIDKVKRGEMYYADLNPIVGSEQAGLRPVLIVSNDTGNQSSPTVIAAISGKPKKLGLPVHYSLQPENGLEMPSIVMLEQLRTLDKQRLQEYIGTLDDDNMKQIDKALAVSLGLHS